MKCILIGAGEYNGDIILKEQDDLVIAVDGGYDLLGNQKDKVDLLIGDFDSIYKIPKNVTIIKYPKRKDYTDMDLAIQEGIKRGYKEFYIYGALGKRIEHSIANISLLLKYINYDIKLIDQNLICFALTNNIYCFNNYGLVSVFSLSENADITIHNMKYDLDNQIITNSFPLGVDNEAIGNDAYIKVNKGTILIITRFVNNN